jgi:anti-anti-sigma factor
VEVGGPGAIVIVRPRGELDMLEEDYLRAALDLACARTSELVVVDCTQIDFIDTTCIGVLVDAGRRLIEAGCRLRLVHVPASMERVLRILALWEYLGGQSDHAGDDPRIDIALAWTDDHELRVTFG